MLKHNDLKQEQRFVLCSDLQHIVIEWTVQKQ